MSVKATTGFSADYWRSLYYNRNNPLEQITNPFNIPHDTNKIAQPVTSQQIAVAVANAPKGAHSIDPDTLHKLQQGKTVTVAPSIAVAPGSPLTGSGGPPGFLETVEANPVLYGSLLLALLIWLGLRYKY